MDQTTTDRLVFIADVLRSNSPCDPMTERTRISMVGEVTGHSQDEVTALLAVAPAVPLHINRVQYAGLILRTLGAPSAADLRQPVHGPSADRLRDLLRMTTPFDRAEAGARRVLADPAATRDDLANALRLVLASLDDGGDR